MKSVSEVVLWLLVTTTNGEKGAVCKNNDKDYITTDYRGEISHTISGLTCQFWTSQDPHIHDSNTVEKNPDKGLGNHNYCRNPDDSAGAWCYTTSEYTRWDYCSCNGPVCEENNNHFITSYYRGKMSETIGGKTCQKWTSQRPHEHERTDKNYPGTGLGDHNFCRDPDNEAGAWCYTTDPDTRWDYCSCTPSDFSKCEENDKHYIRSDYRGKMSKTISGKTCQSWNSEVPHSGIRTDKEYPGKGLGNHNFCRNPDGEAGAWCYTIDPDTRWEFCSCNGGVEAFGANLQDVGNDGAPDWLLGDTVIVSEAKVETKTPYSEKLEKKESPEYKTESEKVKTQFEKALASNDGTSNSKVTNVKFEQKKRKRREDEVEMAVAVVEIETTKLKLVRDDRDAVSEKIRDVLNAAIEKDVIESTGKVSVKSIDTANPPDHRCPSDCWVWVEDVNDCRAVQEERCFKLTCNFDSMVLEFSSLLFDVDDHQTPSPFIGALNPTFVDHRWRSVCALGDCDMTLTSRKVDDADYLIFGLSLKRERKSTLIEGLDVYVKDVNQIEMLFECAYAEEVKLISDEVTINNREFKDASLQFGDLSSGFSIQLFVDEDQTIPTETAKIYLGSTLYVKVEWKVTTLTKLANFFVHSCGLEIGDNTVYMIRDNCYSGLFGVKQLQEEEMVSHKSAFSFKSFIVGSGARSMSYKMECTVKVCSVAEKKCDHLITREDTQCPNDTYDFKAVAFGN